LVEIHFFATNSPFLIYNLDDYFSILESRSFTLIFTKKTSIVLDMKNIKEFIIFYTFFFLSALILLTLYSMSFYLDNFLGVFKNYNKLLYMTIYSGLFSTYFTMLVLHELKLNKILIFISGLLIIFSLQDLKRNLLFGETTKHITYFLENLSGLVAILIISTSIYLNIKSLKKYNKNTKKSKKIKLNHKPSGSDDENYFL